VTWSEPSARRCAGRCPQSLRISDADAGGMVYSTNSGCVTDATSDDRYVLRPHGYIDVCHVSNAVSRCILMIIVCDVSVRYIFVCHIIVIVIRVI
jgi:hypothetical protein